MLSEVKLPVNVGEGLVGSEQSTLLADVIPQLVWITDQNSAPWIWSNLELEVEQLREAAGK